MPGADQTKHEPTLLGDQVAERRNDAAQLATAAISAAKKTAGPGPADPRSTSSGAILVAGIASEAEDTRAAAVSVGKAATAVFSDDEEAFFKAGLQSVDGSAPPADSFNDLDDGYEPQGFWDRLIGRQPTRRRR